MGYIDKSLMEGERVVYRPRLHSAIYWRSASLAAVGILLLVFPTEGTLFHLQIAACLLLVLFAVLGSVSANGGRQYALTNKRIIAKKGIVERNSLELMLRKCEGVQIKQTMLGRIFNYGTVYVTTGEATNSFEYIQDPIVFSTKIHQMIDALKASE